MRIPRWMKSVLGARHAYTPPPPAEQPAALREFVYLDEVSLRSLLSSQTGEMTDEVSDQVARSRDYEIAAAINASVATVGGAEVSSRFQTSNSSTLQTSRKATVQSWFRELHRRSGIRLIGLPENVGSFEDEAALARSANGQAAIRTADLKRGSLVEFRARLTADPVFHMSTMVAEFMGIAADFPERMAPDIEKVLKEVGPIHKLLEKLLAGLIPVRAEALDYVVATVQGEEYLVHEAVARKLALDHAPLVVVGVTEHLAYWKDIRRVLFSEAEFTIMCRVARSELQSTWTPVKLADLFRKTIPDLMTQIETASRFSLMPNTGNRSSAVVPASNPMVSALSKYADALAAEIGFVPTQDQGQAIAAEIASTAPQASTSSGQRAAFARMRDTIAGWTSVNIEPDKDLELRDTARAESGLPNFPIGDEGTRSEPQRLPLVPSERAERLLDVEVVAIYW